MYFAKLQITMRNQINIRDYIRSNAHSSFINQSNKSTYLYQVLCYKYKCKCVISEFILFSKQFTKTVEVSMYSRKIRAKSEF